MTVPAQEPQDNFAQQLVESGAQPVADNAEEILRRMQELEAKYNALAEQQGVITDPVGHARHNLVEHLRAHAAANPDHAHDLNAVADAANDPASNPELVTVLLDDLLANLRLDLGYVAQLARDFRKALAS